MIIVGSLSKPVWGGLRIGWIRASTDLVQRLAALRASIDMGGAVLDQLVAAADRAAAARADARAHRDAARASRRAGGGAARHLPEWTFALPHGGISLWAELDAPLSTSLTMLAAPAGVIVVPGSRFGVDGTLERFLRVPFSLPADQLRHGGRPACRRVARARPHRPQRNGVAARQLVVA